MSLYLPHHPPHLHYQVWGPRLIKFLPHFESFPVKPPLVPISNSFNKYLVRNSWMPKKLYPQGAHYRLSIWDPAKRHSTPWGAAMLSLQSSGLATEGNAGESILDLLGLQPRHQGRRETVLDPAWNRHKPWAMQFVHSFIHSFIKHAWICAQHCAKNTEMKWCDSFPKECTI